MSHATPPLELGVITPEGTTPARTSSPSFASKTPASSLQNLNLDSETGSREGLAQELPPVDGGRGAWSFVVAAFFLETFVWGWSFSAATVLVYLQRNEPWSQYSIGVLSAIGSVNLGVQYLIPLPVTILFRRHPEYVKSTLWASVVLYSGSMLLSSWATKPWQLVVLQGIVCGASGSTMYTPVLMWLNDWWLERKGLAGGIIFAGAGIGGLVFPFILSSLMSRWGFSWMVRVWSIITGVALALSVYLLEPRVPPRKMRRHERGPWFALDSWAFLRNPIMLLTLFASFVSSLSTFPVSLYLATYASKLTPSAYEAEIVVGVYNAAASLGSGVTGALSDWDYPLATALCGALGAVFAFTAWGLANSLAKTYGFAVLFGGWSGCARDVSHGNPYVGSLVFGVLSIVRGLASIVMPFVSEGLYRPEDSREGDAWGRFGFARMMIFVGVTASISALAGVALKVVRMRMVKAGKLRA